MQRHGDFDSLPNPEENTTLADAKRRFPDAFAAEDGPPADLPDDSPVELETSTGAMTVYDQRPGGANWVYFPGEGWDGY